MLADFFEDYALTLSIVQKEEYWRESVEQAEKDAIKYQGLLTVVSDERDRLDAALQVNLF